MYTIKTANKLNIGDEVLFVWENSCYYGKVIGYLQCCGMGLINYGEYGKLQLLCETLGKPKVVEIITYKDYPFILLQKSYDSTNEHNLVYCPSISIDGKESYP